MAEVFKTSSTLTSEEFNSIMKLLAVSAILIIVSGVGAYRMRQRKNPELSVKEFLGLQSEFFTTVQGLKSVGVGMVGGLIFGTIDNGGLWFGMDALEPIFVKKFGIDGKGNIAAGLGNTYSDGLGAFLGTFIGIMVSDYSGVSLDDTPIWSNAIGIIIGCLLGIFIGKTFGK